MARPIYKIAARAEWEEAQEQGALAGTRADRADGYIHLSTAGQLAETLDKHYRGRAGLVLIAVDPAVLAADLRWEPARGGTLFPHLYAPLPLSAVLWHRPLDARPDGGFDLGSLE